MYKKLARIGPISCGIFFALMMLFFFLLMIVLGFVFGGDMMSVIMGGMGGMPMPEGESMPTGGDLGAMGAQGLLYGAAGSLIGGFIYGLLIALIYNLIALFTGGIKIKTTDLAYDDI